MIAGSVLGAFRSESVNSLREFARSDATIVLSYSHNMNFTPTIKQSSDSCNKKIARAVVGHLLAANAVEEARTGIVSAPFPDALRRYFLSDKGALPDNIDIYWWIYPYRRQVVIEGAAKMSTKESGMILGHILNFLPLGFWVLWKRPADLSFQVPTLVPDKRIGELTQTRIALNTPPPREKWGPLLLRLQRVPATNSS